MSRSRIFTHLTRRELATLERLARGSRQGAVAVEIGSYLGASACALARGLASNQGRLFAVDTWTNLAMSEGPRDTFQAFRENTARYAESITPLRGLSTEVAGEVDQEVDLLFVDGDHTYAAVRADLETWLPKLRPGAQVVMHDFGWAEGVRRATREILAPLQIEGGHRLDELYWSRVDPRRPPPSLRASLILPTHGRPDMLADALATAAAQEFPASDYEILVVDNQPGDDSSVPDLVDGVGRTSEVSIRYLPEPRVGLHHARHAGARAARGQILAYVDDDVLLPAGWLGAILEPFADPEVAIVGGPVEPRWQVPPPDWWRHFPDSFLSLVDLGGERLTLEDPCLIYGCNMAIRRSVLFELGGFPPDGMADRDQRWLRGDGETGLCREARDRGHQLVYEPAARLQHCIPAKRLTPAAMCGRGLKSGLSLSYGDLKSDIGRRGAWLRQLGRSLRAFIYSVRCGLRSKWPGRGSVKHRDASDAWLWRGYAGQHMRALISRRFRRTLLRDDHLAAKPERSGTVRESHQ